jgi:hypothetical protein
MRSILIVIPAVLAFTAAWAQAPAHIGTWTGTMEGPAGRSLPVEIQLTDTAGTFRMSPPAGANPAATRNNPCFGKSLPVVVHSSPDGVMLEVRGSDVIPGCVDTKITLTGSGAEYKGQTGAGRPVTLTRK